MDVNLLDGGWYADDPHRVWDWMRREAPIHYDEVADVCGIARYDDVLGATKNLDAFQASFREPGVVVPPEEMLISEIPEPRHGKIRRIINSAIAQHRIGRVEPHIFAVLSDQIGTVFADVIT